MMGTMKEEIKGPSGLDGAKKKLFYAVMHQMEDHGTHTQVILMTERNLVLSQKIRADFSLWILKWTHHLRPTNPQNIMA